MNQLQEAIREFAELSLQYHSMVAKNYNRSDLTVLINVGGSYAQRKYTIRCVGTSAACAGKKIPSCGFETTIILDGPNPPFEYMPRNACPKCNGFISVPKIQLLGEDIPGKLVAVPTEETYAEWKRVSKEQHDLHMKLYESRKRVESLGNIT